MRQLFWIGACILGASLFLAPTSRGHGGQWRGPGDTVPPGGGGGPSGSGPTTPGPQGPSGPGPAGPGSGPASGPPGVPGGPASTRGSAVTGAVTIAPDLTAWTFWWGFNKDPYLNLKDAVHSTGSQTGDTTWFLGIGQKADGADTMRPTEKQVRGEVVPALLRALEEETNNDIVTGCLIALAKIGEQKSESGESSFQRVIARFLDDPNQEIAETAAVALGILADRDSFRILADLARDTEAGRILVDKTEIPYRTRAFACFGLGQLGMRTSDHELRRDVNRVLMELVSAPRMSTRDVKVAALVSIGLVPLMPLDAAPAATAEDGAPDPLENALSSRAGQIAFVLDYFADKRAEYMVRAHAPRTLALLVQGAPEDARARVLETLRSAVGKHEKERREVRQSCTLALGRIADADLDDADRMAREELLRIAKEGQNQERYFALIALAHVAARPGEGPEPEAGVAQIRKLLQRDLVTGRTGMRPWSGLALGVLGRERSMKGLGLSPDASLALRTELRDARSPDQVGAYAIACGLRRDVEAGEALLAKLDETSDEETLGYVAVGLGLLGERSAIEPIQEIVRKSSYRHALLRQAAIALGLLGDKDLVPYLVDALRNARSLGSQAALASALGTIGDTRSIDPLVSMLGDDQLTDRARGFAAVALGIAADRARLPWNSHFADTLNYRANTRTLTDPSGGTGILDML